MKLAKLVVAVGVIVAATATPALAEISYPGGGIWDHGLTGSTVYSDYYHPTKCHGSTSVGTFTDRDSAFAGFWSITEATRPATGAEAYYRTTCG
ncbi:lactococcin 972 family bacteriocin [Streptomyces sp. NPDC050428]|uniref:lactococcin 972 family bacteriocin n=1 Tax=Streptomyces sp. NPDC050428 TaxID=3155757 RepID=UPI003418DC1F